MSSWTRKRGKVPSFRRLSEITTRKYKRGGVKGSVKRGHPDLRSGYTPTIKIGTKNKYYKGDLKDGLPHGYGQMTYANGDVYEGQWKAGRKEGQGKFTGCTIYEGQWKNGKRHGKGKMIQRPGTEDEEVYEGEWENGLEHGNGVKSISGWVYRGEFKMGEKHGQGTMTFEDGNEEGLVYEGEWEKDDYKNGKMTYANGDVYEGNWLQGQAHGHGKMTYANGDVYEGEWMEGEMEGHGKMTYANGDVYEGKGKPRCIGVITYANGDIYKGMVKRLKKFGRGIMTYANGDVYDGLWIEDIRFSGIITSPLRLPTGELSGLFIRVYNVTNNVQTEYIAKHNTGRSISVGRKRGSPSLTKTQKSQRYAKPAADLLTGFPGDEAKTVRDLLKDKDNIIVTNTGIQDPSSNKLVFSVDAIRYFLKKGEKGNQAENWFYECLARDPKTGRDINPREPYIGFYVSPNGNKGLVSYDELDAVLHGGREFELTKTGNFTKTRSWGASYLAGNGIDYVSAKHCQDGSDFDVYSLKPVMLSKIHGSPTSQRDISPSRSRMPSNRKPLEKLPPLPPRLL